MCGYNTLHYFSFCVTVNSVTGMNCSSSRSLGQGVDTGRASFTLYQAAVQWLQNYSLSALELLDAAIPVAVLPGRSMRPTHQPLSLFGDCARGTEDYTFDWQLTSAWIPSWFDCKYSEVMRAFYKATLLGDSAVHVRIYSTKHCQGQAYEDMTVPLNQCLTVAGQPFTTVFQMVYDPQSPHKVAEKVWNAGGITTCEWHPMYDGAGAATATDGKVLV